MNTKKNFGWLMSNPLLVERMQLPPEFVLGGALFIEHVEVNVAHRGNYFGLQLIHDLLDDANTNSQMAGGGSAIAILWSSPFQFNGRDGLRSQKSVFGICRPNHQPYCHVHVSADDRLTAESVENARSERSRGFLPNGSLYQRKCVVFREALRQHAPYRFTHECRGTASSTAARCSCVRLDDSLLH